MTESLESCSKHRLLQARHRYVQNHPAFLFPGEEAVCPDCVIQNICAESRFNNTEEDMNSIYEDIVRDCKSALTELKDYPLQSGYSMELEGLFANIRGIR